MLTMGFKSTIATLWVIGDNSALIVAEKFYKVLSEQRGRGEEMRPAYALHEATKVLQEKIGKNNFIGWIPFVHFGV